MNPGMRWAGLRLADPAGGGYVRGGPRRLGPVSAAAALCLYLAVNISYLGKAKELLKSIRFPLYF